MDKATTGTTIAAPADDDARLRADIRLLGRFLGDTVRDQEGGAVFGLVEKIRQTSVRVWRMWFWSSAMLARCEK